MARMGIPFVDYGGEDETAFVRLAGPLPELDDDLAALSCAHEGMDGEQVTEALVSGPAAVARVRDACPEASVTRVRDGEWVAQCILAASDPRELAPYGMLAVLALRAPREEWHLVEHPRALLATEILSDVSKCFERWQLQM